MTFTLDAQVAAVLAAAIERTVRRQPRRSVTSPAAASRSTRCWSTSTTKRSQLPAKSTSPTTVSPRPTGPRCSRGGTACDAGEPPRSHDKREDSR